jgi:hypothetical protein
MNPHQSASIVAGHGPRVINGEPSMINYLDALNAFELVREADAATGKPAAASFKHVSPAGAALAGAVDATAARIWRVGETGDGGLLSAYVRARDADPKSSFGDVAALSRPADLATAEFLRTVICDAVIAPGFEPGTAWSSRRSAAAGSWFWKPTPGECRLPANDATSWASRSSRIVTPCRPPRCCPTTAPSTRRPGPTRCSGW